MEPTFSFSYKLDAHIILCYYFTESKDCYRWIPMIGESWARNLKCASPKQIDGHSSSIQFINIFFNIEKELKEEERRHCLEAEVGVKVQAQL